MIACERNYRIHTSECTSRSLKHNKLHSFYVCGQFISNDLDYTNLGLFKVILVLNWLHNNPEQLWRWRLVFCLKKNKKILNNYICDGVFPNKEVVIKKNTDSFSVVCRGIDNT